MTAPRVPPPPPPVSITAKYAGTCAKTGIRFRPGTPIQSGPRGWEIAPADIGRERSARSGRAYRCFTCPYRSPACDGATCERCARAQYEHD